MFTCTSILIFLLWSKVPWGQGKGRYLGSLWEHRWGFFINDQDGCRWSRTLQQMVALIGWRSTNFRPYHFGLCPLIMALENLKGSERFQTKAHLRIALEMSCSYCCKHRVNLSMWTADFHIYFSWGLIWMIESVVYLLQPSSCRPYYCYYPFALGPRSCLGQKFAQVGDTGRYTKHANSDKNPESRTECVWCDSRWRLKWWWPSCFRGLSSVWCQDSPLTSLTL